MKNLAVRMRVDVVQKEKRERERGKRNPSEPKNFAVCARVDVVKKRQTERG